MSERGQAVLIWWGLLTMYVYGFCLWGLLDMMPPPPATMSADQVAAFYTEGGMRIRIGAMITSWTSAFMIPITVVIALQLRRLEPGKLPVWTVASFAGGCMMSIFLVLPPLFWGTAAFTVTRMPEITAIMHELGTLTLVTTDQYYIFQMVAIAVISLTRSHDALSPFPRWMGWFTIWAAFMFELGAIAFLPKTGMFAWNGLFVFWSPLTIFGAWITVLCAMMLRSLGRQRQAAANA